MAFNPQEVPTGAVNGVNTMYTVAENIQVIDQIVVDGATYLGTVNFTNNIITLGDAPTVSIFVWYYTSPAAPPTPTDVPGFISVQNAYDALLRRLKDLSDVPTDTFIEWCDFVHQFIYRKLLGTDPSRFIKEVTLSVTAGQSSYNLLNVIPDSDFRSASEWGTGLFQVNAQTGLATDQALVVTGPGSSVQGYYIQGDMETATINITPQPQKNINYCLRYQPVCDRLLYMGDYFTLDTTLDTARTIPDEYLSYVVNALSTLYFCWDEVESEEAYADARFVRSLNELLEFIRKQPAVYALSDFSLTF